MPNRTESILVFRLGLLGDTVVGLPALWAIRKRHPHARITLLTDTHPGPQSAICGEFLQQTRIFSDILTYDAEVSVWGAWRTLWNQARAIRRLKPEQLYYLAPAPRTKQQVWRDRLFFHTVCGIKESHGLLPSGSRLIQRDGQGNPVRQPPEVLRLLRIVNKTDAKVRFGVPVGDPERKKVDLLWNQAGLSPDAQPIALGPGAGMPAKRWPVERYAALAQKLLSEFPDSRLVVVGGREDREIGELICRAGGSQTVNWAGILTVLESAEVLRRCSLFVGNDSGPMHLAASMGTRCVAIFSARDYPGMWEPYGTGHTVLRKQVPCAGCLLKVCEEHALKCLTAISIDEVSQACSSALRNRTVTRTEFCQAKDGRRWSARADESKGVAYE